MIGLMRARARASLAALAILAAVATLGWIQLLVVPNGMMSARWPIFLLSWQAMVAAMMVPAAAPAVVAQRWRARSVAEGSASTGVFLLGYLLVWGLAGVVPLAAMVAIPMSTPRWLPGAALTMCGLYQLSPLKMACLRACRSPLGLLFSPPRSGPLPVLWASVSYAARCLGCCWAAMAALLALGLTTPSWMAAAALLFFLEKNWIHGERLALFAGCGCLVAGMLSLALS